MSLLTSAYNYTAINAIDVIKDPDLKAKLVVKGLNRPTSMIFLSQDEILVAQQLGKVQRIVGKDISQSPELNRSSKVNSTALDITSIINSTGERGLLGIESSRVKQTDKNGNYDNDLKIYLIFTRNVSDIHLNNTNCMLKKCESTGRFVNSVYEYEFRDGKLVNPKLLFDLPLYSNDSIQHIGGAFTFDRADNRIYVTSGDGRGCEYSDCNYKNVYLLDSSGTKEVGGIYDFLTKDVQGGYKVTSRENYSQFAYGIRNSFGLEFDPVTGNLWDTENGPTFGDELNLVKRGFNSGWPLVQGIWPIKNNSEIANNPPPGLPKGYFLPESSDLEDTLGTIIDFDAIKNYSEPEFTWNHSVGVTSIKFFNSDKLGKKYENGMFVGTYKGDIYYFDMDKERNGLLLKGQLKDKVANNDHELRQAMFSQGLSSGIGVTDLEIGPDGYLYVLSYSTYGGAIFKIVPK